MNAEELYKQFEASHDDYEKGNLALEIARELDNDSIGGYDYEGWYAIAYNFCDDPDRRAELAEEIVERCGELAVELADVDGHDDVMMEPDLHGGFRVISKLAAEIPRSIDDFEWDTLDHQYSCQLNSDLDALVIETGGFDHFDYDKGNGRPSDTDREDKFASWTWAVVNNFSGMVIAISEFEFDSEQEALDAMRSKA